MNEEVKQAIVKDIEAARTFIGQAQERLESHHSLWKELGDIYDELDGLGESVQEGDYD